MRRRIVCAFVAALGLTGCESAWKRDNQMLTYWLDLADGLPAHTLDPARQRDEPCGEDLQRCYWLGIALSWGVGIEADPRRGAEILLRTCREAWTRTDTQNTPGACIYLGALLLEGNGAQEADPRRGFELVAEHCARGDSTLACAYRAYAIEKGLGTARDVPDAIRQYEELCTVRETYRARGGPGPRSETREALACMRLAALADEGTIREDPDIVAQLYADACMLNAPPSMLKRDACAIAAEKFFEHGYRFRPRLLRGLREPPSPIETIGVGAEELAAQGCLLESKRACAALKRVFEQQEREGELFDLREYTSARDSVYVNSVVPMWSK